jgi:hypothetical protein
VLGVLDLGTADVETADLVAARLRRALEVVPPERLVAAPDCGMKYLPRERAFRKLEALVAGAGLVSPSLRFDRSVRHSQHEGSAEAEESGQEACPEDAEGAPHREARRGKAQ